MFVFSILQSNSPSFVWFSNSFASFCVENITFDSNLVFPFTSEKWNSEGRSCTKMVRWYTLLFIDKMPLFIGVTSCLWGLLLLLIRMYFWNHLATVSGKVECVAPTRPTRLLTRFLTLALNINHCRFVFCCCETVKCQPSRWFSCFVFLFN